MEESSKVLEGPIVSTFFRYLIPSLVGLLALTSANIVDGIFIGNYVGVEALASVNLIVPIMSLLFGVGLMLSIGGSVRGGKYLGEKDAAAASAIFSKTMIAVALYGVSTIGLGLVFERSLFAALGATEEVVPLMSRYYRIIMPFLFAHLVTIVLYFFLRLDNSPKLSAFALVFGSAVNIALDYVFIARLDWGIAGAGYATGISQTVAMLVLMSYFLRKRRQFRFRLFQRDWLEVFKAGYNGLSEFVGEISQGLVALLFNWMLITRVGVEGVAAITVVNYLLMIGFMVFFSIGDTSQVMVSQNYGARNYFRIRKFISIAESLVLLVSLACVVMILVKGESLVALFLEEDMAAESLELSMQFLGYIWPAYLVLGTNVLISSYLTAVHLPLQSGIVAVSRSLLLPGTFLLLFYKVLEGDRFVMAIPVAEGIALVIAGYLFVRNRPSRLRYDGDVR